MFHFVTLFTVAAETEEAFVRGLGLGGPWLQQARRVAPPWWPPICCATNAGPCSCVMTSGSRTRPYASACSNQAVRKLLNARKQMAANYFEIGAFTFPALKETAGTSNAGLLVVDSAVGE